MKNAWQPHEPAVVQQAVPRHEGHREAPQTTSPPSMSTVAVPPALAEPPTTSGARHPNPFRPPNEPIAPPTLLDDEPPLGPDKPPLSPLPDPELPPAAGPVASIEASNAPVSGAMLQSESTAGHPASAKGTVSTTGNHTRIQNLPAIPADPGPTHTRAVVVLDAFGAVSQSVAPPATPSKPTT